MLKAGFTRDAGRSLQTGSDPDIIEKKSGGGCLTARSDRAVVNFGGGLPDEEIAYLCALIRKILTD